MFSKLNLEIITLPQNYATVAYDSLGNQLWIKRYNGPVDDHDEAFGLAVDSSTGNVYVTGYSPGSGTSIDYTTIKYRVKLDPVEQIEKFIGEVFTLVDEGVLNQGESNALITKLDAALKSLDKENTKAACNQLGAFINQVNALVNSGRLTPEQGQALIDAANEVIEELC